MIRRQGHIRRELSKNRLRLPLYILHAVNTIKTVFWGKFNIITRSNKKLKNRMKSLALGIAATSAILITTACNNNHTVNETSQKTITAIDGYIKDANVSDRAGQQGVYTLNGQYTFNEPISYPLTLSGGTLEDTNSSFDINLSLQAGAVISPITTFLENNSILLEKLTALDLMGSPLSLEDFSEDYILSNNTDFAKLSQLLYVIMRNTNLAAEFKMILENSDPTNLDELFTLAETTINTTMEAYAPSYILFITKVKNLDINASEYETELQSEKNNLDYIIHNGTIYSTVTSPYTGRVWLDRNLGAERVCTAYNDESCYGDYYEWGRGFDGHQEMNSTATTTLATNINNAGGNFILGDSYSGYDWVAPLVDNDGALRRANWTKTDGSSICPVGFRVSSIEELLQETFEQGAYTNIAFYNGFLKLPSAGMRHWTNTMRAYGISAMYTSYTGQSIFISTSYTQTGSYRAEGYPMRCIKDY